MLPPLIQGKIGFSASYTVFIKYRLYTDFLFKKGCKSVGKGLDNLFIT